MQRLAAEGLTVLVPPDANERGGARPGWDGGLYAFMRRALATDRGATLYAKRRVMIEPVFADTKFNRGIDRFLRRGRAAARSEWRLTNTPTTCSSSGDTRQRPRRPDSRRSLTSPATLTSAAASTESRHRSSLRNGHHGKEQPGGALGRSRFAPRALRQPSTAMKNETSVFTRAWSVGE
jgi:hypothetical protein